MLNLVDYPHTLEAGNILPYPVTRAWVMILKEIIKNVITKPETYINLIFNKDNLKYLFLLLAPLVLLSMFSPIYLLIASPEFMINFLSNHSQMRGIDNHYTAVIIPFVFISAIFGAKEVIKRKILDVIKDFNINNYFYINNELL